MVLIETPLIDLTYQFAGTPDRVYSPAPVNVVPGIQFEEDPHIYRYEGVPYPSITQILKMVGIVDLSHIDELILERASAFGKAVHTACHYDDLGDLDEGALSDPIRPYLDAWREAREKLKNEQAVAEIKTSTVIYDWVGLQLAAQQILSGLPTARRVAVQLKANGKSCFHDFRDRSDRSVFLAANSTVQWRRRHLL